MAEKTLQVYHTQKYEQPPLVFPRVAKGFDQWLGEGFYLIGCY